MRRSLRSWLLASIVFGCALFGGCVADSASDAETAVLAGSNEGTGAAGLQGAPGADGERVQANTPEAIRRLLEPRFSTWEEIVERRVIRVLVAYNSTNFFIDGGRQRGITADALHELEKALNAELRLGSRPLHVAAIPVQRDVIFPYLEEGRADLAAANLTVTEERSRFANFTSPVYSPVRELVVTGPGSAKLSALEDLAGRRIHVRPSSSFYDSLLRANARLREAGLAEVEIVPMSEALETEDLLQMVHAGLIPATVADDYLARLWAEVLGDLEIHDGFALAEDRQIAWAVRKNVPGLEQRVDAWVKANRKGTLLGNILIKRYLKSQTYLRRALDAESNDRLLEMLALFEKYGDRHDLDPLLVAAQGYQESGLDQSVVSAAGAVGVMQLLPSTAADKAVGIADISTAENNIHAGTKYLRHLIEVYFNDPEIDPLNRALFAFAGYNAGPNRVNRLRAEAAQRGLDPNIWFGNVEQVVADRVGVEPVRYVGNIFKYYTAYSLVESQDRLRSASRD